MHKNIIRGFAITGIALCCCSINSCTDTANGQTTSHTSVQVAPLSTFSLPAELDFCGEKVPLDIPEVRERAEREFYINLQTPGQLILYIKRAARYFPLFEEECKKAGVPDDLKYLSVAESALFMARSPKDAVGLWQFIPTTAKAYGLIVNEQIDERRNVKKSTRAALSYLKNGKEISGSWTNAAAGYNMGHENLSENRRYQGKSNFYDLFLNEETSRYILRIAIVKHLMQESANYGIRVAPSEKYQPPKTIIVRESTGIPNLAEWASARSTSYKDVKLLNPWILGRSLPAPTKGEYWEIEVPE